MRIERFRYLGGPNVHHHLPVLVAEIELEGLAERESREFEGFNERLLETLPGLHSHTCGGGYPGCFVERLRDGTYFGHIVEHVAIELSGAADISVCYGKTRVIAEPGAYSIVVRCRHDAAMRHLLLTAMKLVEALLEGRDHPLEPAIAEARRLVESTQLGPSTRSIVEAALDRGIPVRRLDDHSSLVQLGWGRRRRLIEAAFTDGTSGVGADIARDKSLTKRLLRDAFVPVPAGREVRTLEEAIGQWREMGERVVVKPVDGHHGNGVTTDVRSVDALRAAFENVRALASEVLIEEQYEGNDYRVLVVGGSMAAASLRRPPEVRGDGRRTIGELIEELNGDPLRGDGHGKPLSKVDTEDTTLLAWLEVQGLGLDAVPEDGRSVRLMRCGNLSSGGSAADVTDLVHPQIRALAERAARVIGLDVCGVDLIAADISRPLPDRGAGIVEVNAGPGLRMHQFPSEGRPRDVGAAIVDLLFPDGSDGRIPTVAVTGTNGKTTVVRMIASTLGATGKVVGMTTTSGVHVGGREVAHGDMTGPRSAQAILCDPAVEVAVLETARGGIVRGGLGYDWSDVAVLTNIDRDHIGQDGIEDEDDLLHIKSLVVERVRDGGTVVLNADDARVLSLAQRPDLARRGCRVVLFSLEPKSFAVRRHLARGGTAYVARGGSIVELCGRRSTPITRIDAIPVTWKGTATFNVANALAAAAACRALGVPAETLRDAFARFSANGDNSGRQNVFEVNGGKLVIDYGHNPAAFAAMGEALRRSSHGRVIGVIGAPGDRADHVLEEGARVVARVFDGVVVKEDDDKRGRRPGEVAQLLHRAIAAERPDLPCEIVLDERAALETALERMRPGDVVVMFYDDLAVVREVLDSHSRTAARRFSGR